MAILAFLSIFGGLHPDPRGHARASRTSSSRASRTRRSSTSSPVDRRRPGSGSRSAALISIAGIALACYCYVRQPGRDAAPRSSALRRGCTASSSHKWYFDELYDALVYRPDDRARALLQQRLRAVVVNGAGQRHRPASCAASAPSCASRRPGSCATTRCCWSRLRRARPLLPGGEQLMAAERRSSACPSPSGARGAAAARRRGRAARCVGALARRSGSRSGWSPTSTPAPPASSTSRRDLDPRARHPLQARRRRASTCS